MTTAGRTEKIEIRVTPDEKAQITANATAAQRKTSDWLRWIALEVDARRPVMVTGPLDADRIAAEVRELEPIELTAEQMNAARARRLGNAEEELAALDAVAPTGDVGKIEAPVVEQEPERPQHRSPGVAAREDAASDPPPAPAERPYACPIHHDFTSASPAAQ